jgi:hypothetical protein
MLDPGLTVPFPLRFPLAFDGKLLGQVLRIFIDTVASNYRKRLADRGIADGECGAVTVIQRANSDLFQATWVGHWRSGALP